jgi:LuxR family maltose regulon positive regulatory protein
VLHPVPELLERHARQRPALIRKIISVLGGRTPAAPAAGPPEQLPEPLSQAEARVLRFLQTSLSAPEIARELYVSVNTIRTHMRHLYDKLGAHRRLEAIDRARALGLLARPATSLISISAGRSRTWNGDRAAEREAAAGVLRIGHRLPEAGHG